MSEARRGRGGALVRASVLLAAAALSGAFLWQAPAGAADVSPFEPLLGRWVGQGRLGVKGNATEQVKCRATYIRLATGDRLKQTIRCASAGGNVEVRSLVSHAKGTITGSWEELVRNMSGRLRGTVTAKGFRVSVKGDSLDANMDIVLTNSRQVIEIQFIGSSLIGLTLVLEKG